MLNISQDAFNRLFNHEFTDTEIVTALARRYPEIFIKLLDKNDVTYKLQEAYGPDKNKVRAIRAYRSIYSTSLREAKDIIEDFIAKGVIS